MDPQMPLIEAHGVATRAKALIGRESPEVADVVVHMEPDIEAERVA